MILLINRFLAADYTRMLITVGDFVGIHKTTAGKYIWKVLQSIAQLKEKRKVFCISK